MAGTIDNLFERAKPPKPSSVNISFSLPVSEAEKFDDLCESGGVDRADVLRRLVRDVLEKAARP